VTCKTFVLPYIILLYAYKVIKSLRTCLWKL